MELPSYFNDFLTNIRSTETQLDDYKTGHQTLRKRLYEDETLSPIIVSTFLQGSYRRATAIRPRAGKRADVDIIVVTKLSEDEYTPEEALNVFVSFLDKYYEGKYEPQGRSFGIELSYVDLDLVITSAPSEREFGILQAESVTTDDTPEIVDDWRLVASWISTDTRVSKSSSFVETRLDAARKQPEWKISPLRIPDRDAQHWQDTHPLAQIQWTWEKNQKCNKHYVNVVKALKWWRRINHPTPKYPKGYPVEHLIGQCCPDGITSVAEGVTKTLERIAHDYRLDALLKIPLNLLNHPELGDRGVPTHNVFQRISGEDFAEFHNQVCKAAKIAREALDAETISESVRNWKLLFGKEFPDDFENCGSGNDDPPSGGFTKRQSPTIIAKGRFG